MQFLVERAVPHDAVAASDQHCIVVSALHVYDRGRVAQLLLYVSCAGRAFKISNVISMLGRWKLWVRFKRVNDLSCKPIGKGSWYLEI